MSAMRRNVFDFSRNVQSWQRWYFVLLKFENNYKFAEKMIQLAFLISSIRSYKKNANIGQFCKLRNLNVMV